MSPPSSLQEEMEKHMQDMHDWFCADKPESKLCVSWYKNEEIRKEAINSGKRPPPPHPDDRPDHAEVRT